MYANSRKYRFIALWIFPSPNIVKARNVFAQMICAIVTLNNLICCKILRNLAGKNTCYRYMLHGEYLKLKLYYCVKMVM